MAILSDLVERIAEVEGIDPATVSLIARHIREDGLIATHGRGPSAAKMSFADAANLLIGVNATTTVANAARTVRAYRRLQAWDFRSLSDPRPPSSLGTLSTVIEQLLDSVAKGELPEPFLKQNFDWGFQEAFSKGQVHIGLRFRRSVTTAYLRMTELPGPDVIERDAPEEWLAMMPSRLSVVFRPVVPRGPPRKSASDRIDEVTIGYRTLRAVGQLIA